MINRIKNIVKRILFLFRGETIVKPVYIPVFQCDLLKGRTAIITGGTSGIGYAIAQSFLSAGATVVITSRSQQKAQERCNKLLSEDPNYKGKVFGVELNNCDVSSFENRFSEIVKLLGNDKKVDILVNNAGIIKSQFSKEEPCRNFEEVLNTNLTGTYFLSKIVANYMKDNNLYGNILNIASSSSLRPAVSPYTISKWGLRGLTIGMAKSLIKEGIVVNGLAPGPTDTPILRKEGENSIELTSSPIGRFATSQEMANMATILVSDLSRTIVGDIVYMTGGAGITTLDDISYEF